MNLDLLAIAAHPDDVELTCGGTLLKMAQAGYKTGILDLTAGEMGTLGTPETRAKEAALAAKILKVKYRGTLGVPDSDVQASREHKLHLAAAIRELRPRTVIIPTRPLSPTKAAFSPASNNSLSAATHSARTKFSTPPPSPTPAPPSSSTSPPNLPNATKPSVPFTRNSPARPANAKSSSPSTVSKTK
jgi:LmbE family N-acetylglucosaminyl deacetylase